MQATNNLSCIKIKLFWSVSSFQSNVLRLQSSGHYKRSITMSNKSARPEGANWASPYIIVKDVDLAVSFYVKAFGFEKIQMVPGDDNTTWHAETRYKDQLLMFGKAGAYEGKTQSPQYSGVESPMNMYLYCENVDDFYQKAITAGAKSLSAPEDTFWHDRMCRLQDPDGYTWCFATHLN
jgi:PhnB protein